MSPLNSMKKNILFICLLLIPSAYSYSVEMYGKVEQSAIYQDKADVQPGEPGSLWSDEIRITENLLYSDGIFSGYAEVRQNLRDNEPVELSIYKAYSLFELGYFSLVLGKARLYESVGQNWNPSDLINPRKSSVYLDERGKEADDTVFLSSISYIFSPGSLSSQINLSALPGYQGGPDMANLSGLFSYQLADLFLSGVYDENGDVVTGGYLRLLFSELNNFAVYSEYRAGNLSDNVQSLFGFEVNITDRKPYRTLLLGEYYRNEKGENSLADYLYNNPGVTPRPGEIQKEYLFGGISFISQKWKIAQGVVYGMNDESAIATGYLARRIGDEVEVVLGGYGMLDDKKSNEYRALANNIYEIYFRVSGAFHIYQNQG